MDCLKANDSALFNAFTDDEEKIARWVKSLKQAYDSDTKQSYFLSKQVFFPIDEAHYHLLLPLTSSSLVQALHEEHRLYFEEVQTKAREQRKARKYSATAIVTYPNKAKLNITGSNHSNASSLNGKRGGKITLFSSAPPIWKSQLKSGSDVDIKGFYKQFDHAVQAELNALKKYLYLLKNKQLSDSKPERAASITRKVQAISHIFFDEVMRINNAEKKGWTQAADLPLHFQLVFEPYRTDQQASSEKLKKQWQLTVSKEFAGWLNKKMKGKRLKLTMIHQELWMKLFAEELRKFIAMQEVEL